MSDRDHSQEATAHHHAVPDSPSNIDHAAAFGEFTDRLTEWLIRQQGSHGVEALPTDDGQFIAGLSYRDVPVSLSANITS
jgi:hypothetical protein